MQSTKPALMRSTLAPRTIAVIACLCATPFRAAADQPDPILCTLQPGTHARFEIATTLSSNESKTGDTFSFLLLDPIATDGCTLPANGSKGSGTIVLAGPAGIHGHEGDLTLRLDSLLTPDGRLVKFDDQLLEINGGNKKVEAGALNVIPDVGIAANFIRGKDVRIPANTPIATDLLHPAIVRKAPSPAPSP